MATPGPTRAWADCGECFGTGRKYDEYAKDLGPCDTCAAHFAAVDAAHAAGVREGRDEAHAEDAEIARAHGHSIGYRERNPLNLSECQHGRQIDTPWEDCPSCIADLILLRAQAGDTVKGGTSDE